MRIRYLLLNAYGGGGTIRTTLSMAGALAARGHDVEVASVTHRRRRPCFPVAPRVRLVSLTSARPPRPRTIAGLLPSSHAEPASPTPATAGSRPHPGPRPLARRYLAAQDDCVVVATRMSLNLALAALRTDRQVAIGQEHNHLAKRQWSGPPTPRRYPALDALACSPRETRPAYRRC